jgi:hypothetical protein
MAAAKVDLLANVAASGAAMNVSFGGRYLMVATGTFSGATVKVQMLGPDGATYVDVPTASLTAAGSVLIYLPWGCTVKGVISSGPPSGIYLSLYRMEG